jgi:predicted porin
MKFRTTAIAMAVAGTVAAPVAVQAGADEMYASARVGIEYLDSGDTADLNVRSVASRFGARGETDLGNGLTGFGRYEWGVDFNDGADGSSISSRHRYVGLKGDFGSALVGRTYHTFYNFVVGGTDVPWVGSGFNQVAYVGRTDKGLTYRGGSDAFDFGATVYMERDDEEDAIDVYEVGASFTFGNDMTLGLAVQGTAADLDDGTGTLIGNSNDEAVVGAMLTGISFGDFSMGVGGQVQDDDSSFIVDVGFNNFYAHVEMEFIDEDSPGNVNGTDDVEPVMFTLGYNQPLGRKTQMYYEAVFNDADDGCASANSDCDSTAVYAVLKYDII